MANYKLTGLWVQTSYWYAFLPKMSILLILALKLRYARSIPINDRLYNADLSQCPDETSPNCVIGFYYEILIMWDFFL